MSFPSKNAALALETGEVFYGYSFGSEGEAYGEAVFNTSMTGYQEILTDPSYKGQIISMTYPEIGNYGTNKADMESDRIHASGFVVKHYSKIVSNFRSEQSLSDFLKSFNIIAIEGIDTRKLTRILRSGGARRSIISTTDLDADSLVQKAKNSPSIENIDLVKTVTCEKSYLYKDSANTNKNFRVSVLDFGCKENILRLLDERGCQLKVYPASTSADELLEDNPHGVFLSNGPGDPSAVPYAVAEVKKLIGKVPIFGICFGHQILAQAYGAGSFKLKFGHRGGNQPVVNQHRKMVEITAQNHGFCIYNSPFNENTELSHYNANDNTLAGIQNPSDRVFSVQYHPEASPGPHDSRYLFDQFIQWMSEFQVQA